MLKNLWNKKGQSTAEYAILIGLVIAAAIGMQTYVKRGMQAKLRAQVINTVGTIIDVENPATLSDADVQFEPQGKIAKSTSGTLAGSGNTETMDYGGSVIRAGTQRTIQATGDYQVYDYESEDAPGEE
ncbi:MAG: hypothetical protein P9L96_02510 [Candidatus Gygaella obscura]|nr:hypothetical protein [Candidatus Gygaella obscura]